MIEKNQNIVLRKVGPVSFLIDVKKSYNSEEQNLLQIDKIGELIWKAISIESEFEDIIQKVLVEFIDEKTDSFIQAVREDILNFLILLYENDMLQGDFFYDI